MTEPLQRPPRKNPMLRTPQMNLPPSHRGRVALGITAGAAEGRFVLQVCSECGTTQYPPREACYQCLSPALHWKTQDGQGELLAETTLDHSNDLYFRERLPWRLGMVRLDAGPSVMVHLHGEVGAAPARVRITARLDRSGQAVLIALPEKGSPHMQDDPMLREMASDPKLRKVLVTDGKSPVGQAMVRTLIGAGADHVWVGEAEPWKQPPGFAELARLPQITVVPLDVRDERSVQETASLIGAKVDIVINTAEMHRGGGIGNRRGVDVVREEMDVNYLGLLRLAQAFGPVLRSRAADGNLHACAWVNLLSIFALANHPPDGTFSASKAAALSLAQCLRAEMRGAGIRVVNIFPGPIDDEWNQNLPPPKLAPKAVASAIVKALQSGVEDVYPGDIAQDWLARWRDNPKVLERELAAGGM
ncbi:SDR family NAD(P)-dependent oxidoreductase [Comamonas badia]|uniref:SDR family NAD(P)-dependent oxidoreductase n=1 Tax=Comamonas badia TaxID=265291 RepID=UPI0004113B3D|nr:SDR family NAD(P)-dependent oxidoreductase [Comamonas badia]